MQYECKSKDARKRRLADLKNVTVWSPNGSTLDEDAAGRRESPER